MFKIKYLQIFFPKKLQWQKYNKLAPDLIKAARKIQ